MSIINLFNGAKKLYINPEVVSLMLAGRTGSFRLSGSLKSTSSWASEDLAAESKYNS